MAQRCPVCGRSFPDYAKHCDQDGAPLEMPAKPRPQGPFVLAAAVACLLALTVVTAPIWLKAYVRSTVSAEIAGVQFPELRSNPDLRLHVGPGRLQITVEIQNRSLLTVSLSNVQYNISVNQARIHQGTISQPITIPPRSVVRQAFEGGEHTGKEWTLDKDASREALVQVDGTAIASAARITDQIPVIAWARLKLKLL